MDAGVDYLQVREPDLETADLAAIVSEMVALARGSRTQVIVNERVDVALACGAAGVHLRADSVGPAAVRPIVPRGFVIGASVHSVDEAVAAASGADYVTAGTVWRTESKPASAQTLGIDGFGRIVSAVTLPVLAIGGVTLERLPELSRAGAAGAAAIGLFIGRVADHSGCRAERLDELVRNARRSFDTQRSAS